MGAAFPIEAHPDADGRETEVERAAERLVEEIGQGLVGVVVGYARKRCESEFDVAGKSQAQVFDS